MTSNKQTKSLQEYLSSLSVAVALVTVLGIAVHDTKIDSLTATIIAPLAVFASYEGLAIGMMLASDPHTHSEAGSFSRVSQVGTSWNPRLPTRHGKQKKHMMQKFSAKGDQHFDVYEHPLARATI